MTLFWLPVYRLKYKDEIKRKRACRYAVHIMFKTFVWIMNTVGVTKVDVKGVEKLENMRGKIIIANHPCLIDVVVLISLIPNADCVVKQALWENVFIGGVLRNTGYISNADAQGLIDDCCQSLKDGSNLVIFPEGTRTTPGTPLVFQRGAANLAIRSGANFHRILIQVTPPGLTKGWPWYKIPPKKLHLQLVVLEEYEIDTYTQGSTSLSVRKLTRDLQSLFDEELNHFDSVL